MRRIFIGTALLFSLNVSNAAFGVKKTRVSSEKTSTNLTVAQQLDQIVKENQFDYESAIITNGPAPVISNIAPSETDQLNTLLKEKSTFKQRVIMRMLGRKMSAAAEGGKSQLTAVLLCFFLGGLGIHRFYMGYTWQGIVQLLTLGGLGIWTLIDFIRLLTGSLQPKNGPWDKTL